jgi:hypothetical protein
MFAKSKAFKYLKQRYIHMANRKIPSNKLAKTKRLVATAFAGASLLFGGHKIASKIRVGRPLTAIEQINAKNNFKAHKLNITQNAYALQRVISPYPFNLENKQERAFVQHIVNFMEAPKNKTLLRDTNYKRLFITLESHLLTEEHVKELRNKLKHFSTSPIERERISRIISFITHMRKLSPETLEKGMNIIRKTRGSLDKLQRMSN